MCVLHLSPNTQRSKLLFCKHITVRGFNVNEMQLVAININAVHITESFNNKYLKNHDDAIFATNKAVVYMKEHTCGRDDIYHEKSITALNDNMLYQSYIQQAIADRCAENIEEYNTYLSYICDLIDCSPHISLIHDSILLYDVIKNLLKSDDGVRNLYYMTSDTALLSSVIPKLKRYYPLQYKKYMLRQIDKNKGCIRQAENKIVMDIILIHSSRYSLGFFGNTSLLY